MYTAYLDGAGIEGKADLHRALAGQLKFPDHYGHSLDALYDILTTEREEPRRIVIRHPAALETKLGGYYRAFLQVLEDISAAGGAVETVFWEENER